jgi:hypothetical protein
MRPQGRAGAGYCRHWPCHLGLAEGPGIPLERPGEIQAPTLLVGGADDPRHPQATVQLLASRLRGAEVVWEPFEAWVDHHRAEQAATVLDFLRRLGTPEVWALGPRGNKTLSVFAGLTCRAGWASLEALCGHLDKAPRVPAAGGAGEEHACMAQTPHLSTRLPSRGSTSVVASCTRLPGPAPQRTTGLERSQGNQVASWRNQRC